MGCLLAINWLCMYNRFGNNNDASATNNDRDGCISMAFLVAHSVSQHSEHVQMYAVVQSALATYGRKPYARYVCICAMNCKL